VSGGSDGPRGAKNIPVGAGATLIPTPMGLFRQKNKKPGGVYCTSALGDFFDFSMK